jgi:hypothetical protein
VLLQNVLPTLNVQLPHLSYTDLEHKLHTSDWGQNLAKQTLQATHRIAWRLKLVQGVARGCGAGRTEWCAEPAPNTVLCCSKTYRLPRLPSQSVCQAVNSAAMLARCVDRFVGHVQAKSARVSSITSRALVLQPTGGHDGVTVQLYAISG